MCWGWNVKERKEDLLKANVVKSICSKTCMQVSRRPSCGYHLNADGKILWNDHRPEGNQVEDRDQHAMERTKPHMDQTQALYLADTHENGGYRRVQLILHCSYGQSR